MSGWPGDTDSGNFRVLDLDSLPHAFDLDVPPPVPILAFGDASHPFACRADVRAADLAALSGIMEQIDRFPEPAAILVQLLRLIERMQAHEALVAESLAYGVLQGGTAHREWRQNRLPSSSGKAGALHVERLGDVLHLAVDRTDEHNAIDVSLRDALHEALSLAEEDGTIQRVELTAMGKAFGVGADLTEFGTTTDPVEAHAIRMRTLPALMAIQCSDRLVARVQGLCIGASLELAAFAGRVEARSGAIFQLPELKMGLIPGAGGCVSVSRRIGRQRTAQLVLSGRRIGAEQALDWGLIDAIVD